MSNSIMVIQPYRHAETWVFDEPRVDLDKEPFVNGIPEMIDHLIAENRIKNADSGFRMLFSATPFPGYQRKLVRLREEMGGNWYREETLEMDGWLCPALFKFFDDAPETLYVKAEPLKQGLVSKIVERLKS